jgi:hypothetical protein
MIYQLTRDDLTYDVELDYQIGEDVPPYLWHEDLEGNDEVMITGAWCDGKPFPLTDAEVADAEDWILGQL